MRYLLSLCLVATLLVSVNRALAEGSVGLSAFAIQHPRFPCTKFLEAFRGVKHPAISILDGWFGSDRKCLNRFIKSRTKPMGKKGVVLSIEVHIRYIPKNRPEVLDKNLLSARAKKWEYYRVKYPHVRFLLSDGLESHDYTQTAKRRVLFIKKYFKGEIVHNPLIERDPDIVGADFIELHESRYRKSWGRKTIFNYDGFGVDYRNEGRGRVPFQTSIPSVRSDITKAKRDGSILFLWDGPSQGIYNNRHPIDARFRSFEVIGNNIKNDLLKR